MLRRLRAASGRQTGCLCPRTPVRRKQELLPRLTLASVPSINFSVNFMPTYEYVCEKCGHHFEQVQPMSAKPLSACPKELCAQKTWGKGKVKRVISGGSGLIFKGSGFYITDYRSDSYKAAAKKDAAAPSTASSTSGTGGSSSSTESKPAAKPESKPKPTKV